MNITYKSLNVLPEFNFLSKSALFVPEVSSCLWISSGFTQNNCNLTNMHKKSLYTRQFGGIFCYLTVQTARLFSGNTVFATAGAAAAQLFIKSAWRTAEWTLLLTWQKQCFQITIKNLRCT